MHGKVADFLGTKHTEIICTEQEFLDAIPEVIQQIESYDTTTVRASVGNYLVSKYICRITAKQRLFLTAMGQMKSVEGYYVFSSSTQCRCF